MSRKAGTRAVPRSSTQSAGLPPTAKGRATRERILAATRSALEDLGPGRLNVSEIVSRAETSRANFYKHFQDLADILLELAEAPMAELVRLAETERPPGGSVTVSDVQAWMRATLEVRDEHAVVLRAVQEIVEAGDAARAILRWERWREAAHAQAREWIREARVAHEIDDPIPLDDMTETLIEAIETLRRRRRRQAAGFLDGEALDRLAHDVAVVAIRLVRP